MADKFKLTVDGDGEAAYLALPEHPTIKGGDISGCVAKVLRLADLAPDVKGADIMLDIDKNGHVIGIEILVDDEDDQ